MADLFGLLTSFPPHSTPGNTSETEIEQKAHEFVSHLRKISPSDFTRAIPNLQTLDSVLDPSTRSISYLFLLLAHHQAAKSSTAQSFAAIVRPGGGLWCKIAAFLQVFDTVQVRYAGHEFNKLVELFAKESEVGLKPLSAITSIQQAMLRLDSSGSTFTSIHTIFVRLCLLAQCYLPATRVLDRNICHFPTTADKTFIKWSKALPSHRQVPSVSYITASSGLPGRITHRTYLEYFLYGAMIYIGLKQWERARHFLQIVISAPAKSTISMVMVEAYKKWVLVTLLEKGSVPSIPHTVSISVAKIYRALAKQYDALAVIFKTGSIARLKSEIIAGKEFWRKDNNTGLVIQILDACRRHSIRKLEQTFVALPVPDTAQRLGLENRSDRDVELHIVKLLSTAQLSARLFQSSNPADPTILRFDHFSPALRGAAESKLWDQLLEQKKRVDQLVHDIYGTDIKLELGRDYIDGLKKAKWRKNGSEAVMMTGEGNNSMADFEEDIMADLH
ncbi:hypothetical protein LOZ53_002126 [Ophidiomyces ophidiicola]|nr:hypothetical protein LOZ55_003761 [Ophidiomyces ophidiicola]KAI1989541.1 hypothetical protein LOZ54_002841 [Ophidiomyces ophidiicola]KAI1993358.1 hypothetical protein LOZ53_002126 [Ophidiomyces ophidiicola]KAI1995654.1 hypothetical protein LOZ51_003480 [Ophidiomyces ophidiicola]